MSDVLHAYTVNANCSSLTPEFLRILMDKCGDSVRFQGHPAQRLAYDRLMFLIAKQELPKEINEDAARRFGLYPSRFDIVETEDKTFVEATLDGEVVGRIQMLAVPTTYVFPVNL